MEYRGKTYSVVVGIDGHWRWMVELDGVARSGKSRGRPEAIREAERAIDKALDPKKRETRA